jgi:hypothetical protein
MRQTVSLSAPLQSAFPVDGVDPVQTYDDRALRCI